MLPSEPGVTSPGWTPTVGVVLRLHVAPPVASWAILSLSTPEYHMLPSGPGAMPNTPAAATGAGNSVSAPAGVTRPTLVVPMSVNQTFPSGPGAISCGLLVVEPIGYSVIVPVGVIRPTVPLWLSVNHRFPSGPAVIPYGRLFAVGSLKLPANLPAPVDTGNPVAALLREPQVGRPAPP